jgi:hypothetical protein
MEGVVKHLRSVDLYPKTKEEHRIRTVSGALLSLLCLSFIFYLFWSEINAYTTVHTRPDLSVDTSFGELLRINIDVSFPRLPCILSSIDAMDISGFFSSFFFLSFSFLFLIFFSLFISFTSPRTNHTKRGNTTRHITQYAQTTFIRKR